MQGYIAQYRESRPEGSQQLLALLRISSFRVLVPAYGGHVVLQLHVVGCLPGVWRRSLWQFRRLVASDCRRVGSPEHLNQPGLRSSGDRTRGSVATGRSKEWAMRSRFTRRRLTLMKYSQVRPSKRSVMAAPPALSTLISARLTVS